MKIFIQFHQTLSAAKQITERYQILANNNCPKDVFLMSFKK
jgi:hypothetical protein